MENAIFEMKINAPLKEESDILIIGGGPSGVAAAIKAARMGKKVVLLEQSGQLGGMATLGNVAIFMSVGNVKGFYREISEKLCGANKQFNPLIMRYLLLNEAIKAGVKIYFHTKFVSSKTKTDKDDKTSLCGIFASSREGLLYFKAKRFIDCTGDARVAIDSGSKYHYGRNEDGLTQPVTLMFQMQDIGKKAPVLTLEGTYDYKQIPDLPQGRHLFWESKDNGTLLVNMTRVRGNGALVDDVNNFEAESLRQAFSVASYLQKNGFENYILSTIAAQTGVRESNQIEGVYTLTEEDVISGAVFEDVVARSNYEIDIHSPDGKGTTDERHVEGYDIPYRIMIPIGFSNLLVSGRAVSATHVAMSSLRVMPTCFNLGDAAGAAASISIDENTNFENISIKKLHENIEL